MREKPFILCTFVIYSRKRFYDIGSWILIRRFFQERKVYDEVFSFSQQAMINYMVQAKEKEEQKNFMDNVGHF